MLCPSCGAVNPSGSRFCMSCGTSLETTSEPISGHPSRSRRRAPSRSSRSSSAAPIHRASGIEPSGIEHRVEHSVRPSAPVSEPVSEEPIGGDALLSDPVSAEPAGWAAPESVEQSEPISAEPAAPSPHHVGPVGVRPGAVAGAPGVDAARDSAPAPAPRGSSRRPLRGDAAPERPSAPAPALAPPAPAPQPMPPAPSPTPGDPFALGAAAQRLDQSAQAAAHCASWPPRRCWSRVSGPSPSRRAGSTAPLRGSRSPTAA